MPVMQRKLICMILIILFPIFIVFAYEGMQVSFGKVSAKIPPGWLAQSIDDATMIFIFYSPDELNDRFRERITVTGGDRSEGVTTNQTISILKDSFLSYYDEFEVLENGMFHILIQGKLNGIYIKQYIKFISRKDLVYCITATALPDTYPSWEPIFMEIIDSVKIKN